MKELMELAGFFTAHGVWIASSRQGPVVPHMVTEKDGERSLTRLEGEESMEAAVEKGSDLLLANPTDAERGILFFDAFITIEEVKLDALILRGVEFGETRLEVEIIQPYRPASAEDEFLVMQPKVSFPEEEVNNSDDLVKAFFSGLDQHEEGGPLWTRSLKSSAEDLEQKA